MSDLHDEWFQAFGTVTLLLDNGLTAAEDLSLCRRCSALVPSGWMWLEDHVDWHARVAVRGGAA